MNATDHKTLSLHIDAKYMFCAQSIYHYGGIPDA